MFAHIPFDIRSDILKRLPIKLLLQFRSISKQWKSFIDNPEFINNYHINPRNPQHHLLVSYELDIGYTHTLILDNNTFPQQKFPLPVPESLSLIKYATVLGSVDGLLCFYGDVDPKTEMAIIWNPTVRKSVGVIIPLPKAGYVVVGLGVCPYTSDPKLVKMTVSNKKIPSIWMIEVFTLSTRVWKTVYMGAPFKSCVFAWIKVFVNGVMYFSSYGDVNLVNGVRSNFIISLNLKSEKLAEVCLPERLVHTRCLDVAKVNESLGLLEYYREGGKTVCGVWTRKGGANKTFNKIYTVKVEGKSVYDRVLGFRYNGEAVVELNDSIYEESRIEVYEPLSGHTNGVGIKGLEGTFSASSYTETLLLLNESNCIIKNDDGAILEI